MPLDVKATRAQFVIENSGNLEDSRQQVSWMDRGVYYSYFYVWEKKWKIGFNTARFYHMFDLIKVKMVHSDIPISKWMFTLNYA